MQGPPGLQAEGNSEDGAMEGKDGKANFEGQQQGVQFHCLHQTCLGCVAYALQVAWPIALMKDVVTAQIRR